MHVSISLRIDSSSVSLTLNILLIKFIILAIAGKVTESEVIIPFKHKYVPEKTEESIIMSNNNNIIIL